MPRKKKQTVIEKLPLKYVAVILIGIFVLAWMLNSWLPENVPPAHPTVTAQRWSVPLPTMTQIPSRTPIPLVTVKIPFSMPTQTPGVEIHYWETWNGKVVWTKVLTIRPQPYASGGVGFASPNSVWEFDAYQIIEWRDESGKLLYTDMWWRLTAQKNGWLPEMLNGIRYLERVSVP